KLVTNLLARDLLQDGTDDVEWTVVTGDGKAQLLFGALQDGGVEVTATPIDRAGQVAVGSPGDASQQDYGTTLVVGTDAQGQPLVQVGSHPFARTAYGVTVGAGEYGGFNFGLAVSAAPAVPAAPAGVEDAGFEAPASPFKNVPPATDPLYWYNPG